MPDTLSVSIVTPSYNHGRFLPAAIDSVLRQDYPAIEYVVMDGGSNDETLQVLRRYNGRFRWVCEPDDGQADAINKGFARTSGQVLCWLNSDDMLVDGAVRAATEYLAGHPDVALVYGDAEFISADGQIIGPCAHVEPYDWRRLLYYSDFIVQPAAFFRRDAFDAVGGLDGSLHWAMDYDLWLKLARRYRSAYIPSVLARYRWCGQNKSAVGGRARLEEIRRVVRRHGANDLPAYCRLEEAALNLWEACQGVRRLDGRALAAGASAAAGALADPRALRSLLSLRTWKVIWTGQILRRSATRCSTAR